MEWLWIIGIIIVAGVALNAYEEHVAQQKEEEFRRNNPKEYVRLQEIAHDKERMKHEKVGFVASFFRSLLG